MARKHKEVVIPVVEEAEAPLDKNLSSYVFTGKISELFKTDSAGTQVPRVLKPEADGRIAWTNAKSLTFKRASKQGTVLRSCTLYLEDSAYEELCLRLLRGETLLAGSVLQKRVKNMGALQGKHLFNAFGLTGGAYLGGMELAAFTHASLIGGIANIFLAPTIVAGLITMDHRRGLESLRLEDITEEVSSPLPPRINAVTKLMEEQELLTRFEAEELRDRLLKEWHTLAATGASNAQYIAIEQEVDDFERLAHRLRRTQSLPLQDVEELKAAVEERVRLAEEVWREINERSKSPLG